MWCRVRDLATWGPLLVSCSLCPPGTEILSFFLGIFRGYSKGISSSHCWSLLNWRHLSVFRPASAGDRSLCGLLAGDCGLPLLRMGHARVWVVPCRPLLREWRAAATLVPLMPCASTGILSGQSWSLLDFPLRGGFGRLVQIFSCLAFSVPVGDLSDISLVDFSSLRLCLVDRIYLGYFLGGYDCTRVPSVPSHGHWRPCHAFPHFLGHSPFHWW